MGTKSVDYYRGTLLSPGDGHHNTPPNGASGKAVPRWGGKVAARLGLTGLVTPLAFDAAFGPGGFTDPVTGTRLVNTTRPGFEIVVSAHKSVAMLGLIGRAEDMHAILDAETTATMDWLERYLQTRGGRRGKAATPTPTAGLAYAITTQDTSLAGDPNPQNTVLVANLTEMLDERGGHKALHSTALRDTVEAATMVGRLEAAAVAIKAGYAIEPDDGPSGRLRHWRIRGIPTEVCEIFSKRSREIDRHLAQTGHTTYRARNIAAQATMNIKRDYGIDELMPRWRWRTELADAGWTVDDLVAALEAARLEWEPPAMALGDAEINQLTCELLDSDNKFMARGNTPSHTRLIAEVAPLLYGHDLAELAQVADRVYRRSVSAHAGC